MAAFAIPSNPAYFPKFSLFFLSVLHPVKENKRIVSMVAASKTPFSAHDLCIPPNKLGGGWVLDKPDHDRDEKNR